MKLNNIHIFLLIWLNLSTQISFAQLGKLAGTWVTPDNEVIHIGDTTNKYDASNYLGTNKYDLRLSIFQYGDTLSFQKQYYLSETDSYNLLIIRLNDTLLIVQPISALAQTFFNNKKLLHFTRQAYIKDESIKFEKIIFHTSMCFGNCPVYHLEMEQNKKVKLYAQEVYKMTSRSIGSYFKGEMKDTLYKELLRHLQSCNLRTLEFDGALCCDGSIITIIVYFNGQRKYLKSMFPPMVANDLISFLYQVCRNNDFQKVNEKFEIEE